MRPTAHSYRYANPLWIELPFGRSRWLLKAICFAAIPYTMGLVLAAATGMAYQYVVTDAFLVGAFGIALTTWAILHGNEAQYEVYDDFLSSFTIDDAQHAQIIRNTVGDYTRNSRQIAGMTLMFLLIMAFTSIGLFYWDRFGYILADAGFDLLRFDTLARHGWYDDNVRVTTWLILLVFALFVSVLLSSAFYLIRRMPRMLFRCKDLPAQIPPRYLKYMFASMAGFYTRIGILWLLGVLSCAVFFRGNDGWATGVAILFLASFGIFNYALPQIIYLYVANSAQRDAMMTLLASRSSTRQQGGEQEQAGPMMTMREKVSISDSFTPFLLEYDRSVYPWYQVYLFGIGYFVFVYWPTVADLYTRVT